MSQRIGPFEILRRLEAKAGAACYLGRDTRDGGSVLIDTWSGETAEAQALFLKRAAAARQLEHGAIAGILDFGIDGATSCRIERWPGGETLAARLERSPELALPTILGWLAGIARALECAHDRNIVHGDLHPGAIVIRPDDHVAVRGFAAARPGAHARYQAPELRRGGAVDARADIFAFGVLSHRLLAAWITGSDARSHRQDARSRDLLGRALTEQLGPQAAEPLSSLLDACLEDDPDRRPAGLAAVIGAVEGAQPQLAAAAASGEAVQPEPNDWAAAAVLNDPNTEAQARAKSVLDVQVQKPGAAADASLVELELDGRSGASDAASPPTLDAVADAIRRPGRSRLRRRWLTFAALVGAALWLGGTLWWWKGSPLAGSEAPAAQRASRVETLPAPPEHLGGRPLATTPADPRPPGEPAVRTPEAGRTAHLGTGRLAVAPAWDPQITVSVDGGAPVVLDRRRVFDVEAGVDHVLTFELATRDYQIREQVVTQVGVGRLLETPVPLVRPGTVSVATATDGERPVFVRIGDEAIGWTPIRNLVVPAGDHMLTLLPNPTWQPDDRFDQRIRVTSRQRTTVQFDLESEPIVLIVNGRRVDYVPPAPEPAP